jgi:FtsZ-interacting cell division protein ZipA
MSPIDWLFIIGGIAVVGLLGMGFGALWEDHKVRRDFDRRDQRADWQAKVEAMRRIHDAELDAMRDARGDA